MKRADLSAEVQRTLVRLPPPNDNHYGVVPGPPPEDGLVLTGVAARHRAAEEALAKVDAYARGLRDPFVVSRILARQEAVSSSAIEGTHSTLDEVLAGEETHDDEARAEVRQVRKYAITVSHFIKQAHLQGHDVFSSQLVCHLHKRVMQDDPDYGDPPGRLRDREVWIGGREMAYSIFNPPPASEVRACLQDNVRYMRAEGMHVMQQSIITRMAVAHAHFEAVHPFRDGNGRVGRMLLPIMMAADGRTPLYLAPYIAANKTAYIEALKAAQQRLDWAAMVGFLSDAVVGAADELFATRQALEALAGQWRARRAFRRNSSSLRALALLPQYPVITISRLARLLEVTYPAAATAVGQLEEIGVLQERTGYSRNRIFAAPEALSVLNRPFGADPILPER
jgi:Fic family protein